MSYWVKNMVMFDPRLISTHYNIIITTIIIIIMIVIL